MEVIGLTGGIGSGKSTVAKVFGRHGVPCFNCDDQARRIQDNDPRAVEAMKRLFGDDIYDDDNHLRRRRVGEVAFRDAGVLAELNAIVHPLVDEAFMTFKNANAAHRFVLIESAILVQSGLHRQTDGCIYVKADLDRRIERVMRRDGLSREDVLRRIGSQMPEEEVMRHCKYVVHNDGDISDVERQVAAVVLAGTFDSLSV